MEHAILLRQQCIASSTVWQAFFLIIVFFRNSPVAAEVMLCAGWRIDYIFCHDSA
jgi:hypothetical protein